MQCPSVNAPPMGDGRRRKKARNHHGETTAQYSACAHHGTVGAAHRSLCRGRRGNLPACICETACTAEEMNIDCPGCGAEGAQPENCALYTKVPDMDDPAPEDEDDEAFEEDGTPEGGEASALAPQLAEGGAYPLLLRRQRQRGRSYQPPGRDLYGVHKGKLPSPDFQHRKVNVAYAYLENDITLDDDLRILGDSDQRGKTLYLCLNGHTLNLGQYFIWVGYMDCTLYLCDCSAQRRGRFPAVQKAASVLTMLAIIMPFLTCTAAR